MPLRLPGAECLKLTELAHVDRHRGTRQLRAERGGSGDHSGKRGERKRNGGARVQPLTAARFAPLR